MGWEWDHRMLEIDFENVTKRIEDYIFGYIVSWKNHSRSLYKSTSASNPIRPHLSFIGVNHGGIIKCYGINIPMNARSISIGMKRDIFPGGVRHVKLGLAVSFHYPNQFFRSLDNMLHNYPTHIQSENQYLEMLFKISTFEVTIRRNSRTKQCSKNWKGYDIEIARNHYEEIGCRHVYDIWNSSYPICNSSETMAMAAYMVIPENIEPCQSADQISFENVDVYHSANDQFPDDSFGVSVKLKMPRIKVIEQKPAYELTTLIGNSGGYIGLLLGTDYIHIHNIYTQCINSNIKNTTLKKIHFRIY
jgi:hypothetical protein